MGNPVISHVLHAVTKRVHGEVHVTVGLHHDQRLTLAFTNGLSSQVGLEMQRKAKQGRRRKIASTGREPVQKPSGGIL